MKKSIVLLSGASALALAYGSNAETLDPSVQSILSTMNASVGSENLQFQVAPSYSELFGLGVRTAVGGQVTDAFALGAIIDYAEHREEYLANAGIQLTNRTRIIGSLGILKESEEFILGDGREDVQQLEYGLSLKGHYDAGLFRGYEINAYQTHGSTDADTVETGDLTGLQIVTALKPFDSSDLRLGAGYESAEWDGGDVDAGYTLQALGSQQLSDTLALNYSAKSAETENTYGLGLTYDMSNTELGNNLLSAGVTKIEGKHGISDDMRVAINWTVGLGGAAPADVDTTISSMGGMPSVARTELLADVMTRPTFLPERVLTKIGSSATVSCPLTIITIDGPGGTVTAEDKYTWDSYVFFAVDSSIDPTVGWTFVVDGNSYAASVTNWGDYSASTGEYVTGGLPVSGTVTFTATAPGYSCTFSLTQGPVLPI